MSKVIKNEFGYYEVEKKPSQAELEEYYEKKYYQNSKGAYQKKYSEEERKFILNRIKRKFIISTQLFRNTDNKTFLDVGCGEGWALNFFKSQSYKITGLDYSTYGCLNNNKSCVDSIIQGDILKNLNSLIKANNKFDIVLLDNVLEHLLSPIDLLQKIKSLLKESGVLIIEVPNDFSILQKTLIKNNFIDSEFWVVLPDHISYFNKDGLIKLCKKVGWDLKHLSTDYPIDFNLFNFDTNYVLDKNKGRNVHLSRVNIENLMDGISTEKTIKLYNNFAEMGLGRNIIGFFQKEQEKNA